MKFRFVLALIIFLAPISAYCTEELENLKEVNTRYGVVTVIDDGMYETIYINKKKIDLEGASRILIGKKWEIEAKDILLISTSNGCGSCNPDYVFLIITGKNVVASEQFGNGMPPDVSKIKNTILVKFPRYNRNSPAETVQYDNGKVYGKSDRAKYGKSLHSKKGELELDSVSF